MAGTDAALTRRGFVVMGGTAVAIAALGRVPAAAQVAASVPTFESVAGFPLGSIGASNATLDAYVQAVADASPRVRTHLLAERSVEGQGLRYVLVSDPANLERLDEIERRMRALRRRPVPAAKAAAAVADLPAFANLIANVHGNEPSGADALARLLYELASRDDEANLKRLRELVFVLMLVQNPDGRDHQRRVNANLFDLNRDWFAFTQPETVAKVRLYRRFPPLLGIDLHEQFLSPPGTFFFPPDNDPVHHESSRAGLKMSNELLTPAMEAAFQAQGYSYEHYGIYDVFYPGYGDIAPNQCWGAAGVLFEPENTTPYPEKYARQFTAADAAVTATAEHRAELLTAWAKQWGAAVAQGRRGRLLPNITQNPASLEPAPVPDERVYGYALRPGRHAADVAHLVDRLRAFDVRVHVTRRRVRVARLRPFGAAAFTPATLAPGTVIVSAAQPLKHWIHILLEDDPHAPVPYFYDVAGWSNPAMMNLAGGAIGVPIPAKAARLREVRRGAQLRRPFRAAPAYAFATDAALAQAAAFALQADGVEVRREPGGRAVVAGTGRSALEAAADRYGLRPRSLPALPAEAVPARRPRVAILHDAGADTTARLFAASGGFARWLCATRFGLDAAFVRGPEIETGALSGYDVLVVPDGIATVIPAGLPNVALSPPGGGLTPAGLAAVQAFVAGGGTFLGWRTQGVAVATAAGIAGDLATRGAPSTFTVPGCPVALEVAHDDVATLGEGPRTFAYNVADPILTGGETTILRYPDTLLALGYQEGLEAVNGTVAGTVARVGAGVAYVFSFDPAYRGFTEATQRMVGSVLLSPPTAARPAAAPRSVRPDVEVVTPARLRIVRVAATDADALREAAHDVPAEARIVAGPGATVELRALDTDPLSGHPAGWQQHVLGRLSAAGVAPVLVVA